MRGVNLPMYKQLASGANGPSCAGMPYSERHGEQYRAAGSDLDVDHCTQRGSGGCAGLLCRIECSRNRCSVVQLRNLRLQCGNLRFKQLLRLRGRSRRCRRLRGVCGLGSFVLRQLLLILCQLPLQGCNLGGRRRVRHRVGGGQGAGGRNCGNHGALLCITPFLP